MYHFIVIVLAKRQVVATEHALREYRIVDVVGKSSLQVDALV